MGILRLSDYEVGLMADKPLFKDLSPEKLMQPPISAADGAITDYPQMPTEQPPIQEGELGEHYRVLSLLGRGGMGDVYKVLDLRTNQIVAAKVIRAELARDATAVKRFRREAEAAMGLLHPNLVPVYSQGVTTSGAPYIVMEYQDGQSLADLLKEQDSMSVDDCLHILEEVCLALEHAHAKGIVHRDLKPGNILITQAGKVRVVDFGIAKVFNRESENAEHPTMTNLTKTGDFFGSPAYMSPEQCLGKELDSRSDIYSLGCVAYQMLSGQPPFGDGNPVQIILNHVNQAALPLRQTKSGQPVPAALTDLLRASLEKEPDHRPHSMRDLRKSILCVQTGDRTPQAIPGEKAFSEFFPQGSEWRKYLAVCSICCVQMSVLLIMYAGHEISLAQRSSVAMSVVKTTNALNQLDNSFETMTWANKANPFAYKSLWQAQAAVDKLTPADFVIPPPDDIDRTIAATPDFAGCIDSLHVMADTIERPQAYSQPEEEKNKQYNIFSARRRQIETWHERLKRYDYVLSHDGAVGRERNWFVAALIGFLIATLSTVIVQFGTGTKAGRRR